jgi:hypothetical protein
VITWRRQEKAVVGSITLRNGQRAGVVLVEDASNPRGAALVLPPGEGEKPKAVPLKDALDKLDLAQAVEILCMQERCFGKQGLPEPAVQG